MGAIASAKHAGPGREAAPKPSRSLLSKVVGGQRRYYAVETVMVDGRPKMVGQTHLGTLEAMVEASEFIGRTGLIAPDFALVLDFGAVASLLDIAERLGVREAVNRQAPPRLSGPTLGDCLLLGAIHRAVVTGGTHGGLGDWFERTVLTKSFPEASAKTLGGHALIDCLAGLDEAKVQAIEDELSSRILEVFGLEAKSLVRDSARGLIKIDAIGKAIIDRGTRDRDVEQDRCVVAHGFGFLLAQRLTKLLAMEVKSLGHSFTVPRMMRSLGNAQQIVNTYHVRHKVQHTYAFSRLRGLAREYCDKRDLKRYALP